MDTPRGIVYLIGTLSMEDAYGPHLTRAGYELRPVTADPQWETDAVATVRRILEEPADIPRAVVFESNFINSIKGPAAEKMFGIIREQRIPLTLLRAAGMPSWDDYLRVRFDEKHLRFMQPGDRSEIIVKKIDQLLYPPTMGEAPGVTPK
jgi:hypothetical protein